MICRVGISGVPFCALFPLQVDFRRCCNLKGSSNWFQCPLAAPRNVGSGSFCDLREPLSTPHDQTFPYAIRGQRSVSVSKMSAYQAQFSPSTSSIFRSRVPTSSTAE
jgi:hypothetical protein